MAGIGKPKTGGRKKGVRNKLTKNIRLMVLQALDDVGGVKYLVEQAKENPAAFMTLIGKVIPPELKIDATGENISVTVNFGRND